MIETQSFSILNDKFNALSLATNQNAQEIQGINKKIDAFTGMLQTLTQTMQEFTEVGSQWHQRPVTLEGPASPIFQETALAPIPRSMKLEFPKFRGKIHWVGCIRLISSFNYIMPHLIKRYCWLHIIWRKRH